MNQSDSIKNLTAALVKFQASAPVIGRDSVNPFFKSKYATLGNIISKITPVLAECGLAVSCIPNGDELRVILMHTSGEFISGSYRMKPVKEDPQALGSAMTYQRRYAITAILNLNVDDDDDGNAASQPQSPKGHVKQKPKLPQDRYVKMVLAIESGEYSKEDALNTFNLTAKQRQEIEAL